MSVTNGTSGAWSWPYRKGVAQAKTALFSSLFELEDQHCGGRESALLGRELRP